MGKYVYTNRDLPFYGGFPTFYRDIFKLICQVFFIEDALIDKAEAAGISNTLCSFHKAFIGAGEYGILQKPKMAITTSMICDGNLNTFRYLAKKYDIPFYIIDVPSKNSENTVEYVKNQLAEIIQMSEEVFSQKFDIDKLREIVKIENKTNEYRRKYRVVYQRRSLILSCLLKCLCCLHLMYLWGGQRH